MNSSRLTFLVAALVAVVTVNACNCGGEIPCEEDTDCPTGAKCQGLVCTTDDTDGGGGSDGGDGGRTDGGGDGGTDAGHDASVPCVGLECQQVTCADGGTTTLTGTVYTPKGDLPLYNAIVYVPNGPVQAFPDGGVTCDRCGPVSGNPVASALTGPDGTFRLENVPAGSNIPLVIQLGKWRRQVTIPAVTACQVAPITDVGLTRLPRNKAEGDIPKMAIATGSADPFECLLLKVGIDPAEVTEPTGNGRVHYYRAGGGVDLSTTAPRSNLLWGSVDTLKQYDVVMLPCEGTDRNTPAKTDGGMNNIVEYTSAGGRMFATHYSYAWIQDNKHFPSVSSGVVNHRADPVNPYENRFDAGVVTSFPKGADFADWLVNVGASETRGWIGLHEVRHNVDSVDAGVAREWISGFNARLAGGGGPIVTHFTFNTPVNPPALPDGGEGLQCGRTVFSSFHVSQGALDDNETYFPEICLDQAPSAQEKALIFMFFDLASCVQDDDTAPEIPTCAGETQACATSATCCGGLQCVDGAGDVCAGGACTCEVIIGSREQSGGEDRR